MENIKILIADDSASVRKFLKYSLNNNFPEVAPAEAANGKEAIVKLENERFDIILSDWDMPQLSGLELLKWVRGHPAYNTTPFIMLTTDSDEKSVVKATQAGATAYLLKPIAIDALVTKLTTTINKFNRRRIERFPVSGSAQLRFGGVECTGNLLDISNGGLLGIYKGQDPLPKVLDRVVINIQESGHNVENVIGFIIRAQAVDAISSSEYVKIAIKFSDDTKPHNKEKLDQFLSHLESKIRD
jgi:CheY-like chemotaxis protein